jgi:hypothetical protein
LTVTLHYRVFKCGDGDDAEAILARSAFNAIHLTNVLTRTVSGYRDFHGSPE